MNGPSRRDFLRTNALAALGLTALGLGACSPVSRDSGSSNGGGGGGGGANIRYGWWGGSDRQQAYNKALAEFRKKFPDIKVDPEFADFDAFQDRIATQMAGRNAPDVFWIAATSVVSFYANGMYHDLDGLKELDLSDFPKQDIEEFKIDGKLNTMPFASFTPALRSNATFLEEQGAKVPDDENWTWSDLSEFLKDCQKDAPKGRRAIAYNANADLGFESWLRSHGQELWTQDGNVGWDAEACGEWFAWWEDLRESGAALTLAEQEGVSMDWGIVGNRVMMSLGNSNHLTPDAPVFPKYEFQLHLTPKASAGADGSHRYVYTPRMAIYKQSANPEAAASLVNFLVNDEVMPGLIGTTMGAPTNPQQRKRTYEQADANGKKVIDAVDRERDTKGRKPRYEAPAGASTWRTDMDRTVEAVSLKKTSIADAAARMTKDIQAAIDAARK
ncbi:ABC transporter substrate-binding protein [Actinopolymorpha alba]|uniref:ABC transporter substrate-binding protein n=1 Tax=Actinopolymorpha alba TaxID=533267 RepID=UPI00037F1194|nr:extracellular solute-binding protein [Actinopolymorpha alba]